MLLNHKYPYEDYTELNLDWVIKCIKELKEEIEDLKERIEALEGGGE